MGNDGGSIAGRAELVRPKKREIRVESELVAKFRAKYCALTKERLRKPIAACRIGYLYNYDSILKQCIDKKLPQEFKHISKVRNIRELNVTENPDPNQEFPFICPISQTTLNGKNRFYVLWGCGCVFNKKIIHDLGIKKLQCPLCGQTYQKDDIVELCPTNEDAEMRRAILTQQNEKKAHTGEHQTKKKVCIEEKEKFKKPVIPLSKMEQLAKNGDDELKDSNIYKSLFHKEYKLEDNLFTRNVRFGIR